MFFSAKGRYLLLIITISYLDCIVVCQLAKTLTKYKVQQIFRKLKNEYRNVLFTQVCGITISFFLLMIDNG